MNLNLKKSTYLFLFIALISVILHILSAKRESVTVVIKSNLERFLSDKTGACVTIQDIRGGIFDKLTLQSLSCGFNGYRVNFESAQLQYSLWDIFRKKRSVDESKDNIIKLRNGSFKVNDKGPICDNIEGTIKLEQDKIILNGLHILLFSYLNGILRGEISKKPEGDIFDIVFFAKPTSEKNGIFISDIAMDIKGNLDKLNLSGYIDISEEIRNSVKSTITFSKDILDATSDVVFEDLNTARSRQLSLKSQVDIRRQNFRALFTPSSGGSIIINGNYSNWPVIRFDMTGDHIKINNTDVSNILHISASPVFEKGLFSHIVLDIETESTIINFQPFDEFVGSIWADNDIVRITSLKLGNSLLAEGALSLKEMPGTLFLKIKISNFDVGRVLLIYNETKPTDIFTGIVSGEIFIEGPLDELTTKANIEVTNGSIGQLTYNRLYLNLKGNGPILTVYDSRILQQNSFLTVDGVVDIRELGTERFLQNVVMDIDYSNISWNGWNISKDYDENKVTLGKDVGSGVKVGFKKYIGADGMYQLVKPKDELELEYDMPDKDSVLQLKSKENEEFFGIVKKQKF